MCRVPASSTGSKARILITRTTWKNMQSSESTELRILRNGDACPVTLSLLPIRRWRRRWRGPRINLKASEPPVISPTWSAQSTRSPSAMTSTRMLPRRIFCMPRLIICFKITVRGDRCFPRAAAIFCWFRTRPASAMQWGKTGTIPQRFAWRENGSSRPASPGLRYWCSHTNIYPICRTISARKTPLPRSSGWPIRCWTALSSK